ncbi:MAG: hypothetical protein ACK5B6_07255, partial [Bacteroidia bacterium]
MFARSGILVAYFFSSLVSVLSAQNEHLRTRAIVEYGFHFLSFRGDVAANSLKASSPMHRLAAGIGFRNYTVLAGFNYSDFRVSSSSGIDVNNFRAFFSGADAQLRYSLRSNNGLSPFVQTGLGYAVFASFGDRLDAQNRTYFAWSDGSLRNVSESDPSADASEVLTRDHSYETRLNSNQSTLYVPLSIGARMKINTSLSLFASVQMQFLQSDNIDNSILKSGWDRMQSLQLGINFSPVRNEKKTENPKTPRPDLKRFDDVDFDALFQSDEDGDGIIDYYDRCLGTPKGAPVDANGCTPDSDGDGYVDFVDAEPDSPADAKVDKNGRAYTDAEIQQQYNDSVGLFVQVLRKVHKGSRPYPVRKHIPIETIKLYEELEMQHPEWKPIGGGNDKRIPAEMRIFDRNND